MQRDIIIIADDEKINRAILANALKEEYKIIEATNGKEVIKVISQNIKRVAAILLDIMMPELDGLEVMDLLNKKNVIRYIPVIFITVDANPETMKKAYEYGAVEFIKKPFDIQVVKNCVHNIVKIYQEKVDYENLAIIKNKELKKQTERLKQLNMNLLEMIGTIVEFRGLETTCHIKRVREYTRVMAESMRKYYPEYNLTEESIQHIASAVCMHDIGKIMVPDSILLKPQKLTPDEFEIIKSHTTKGCEIVDTIAEYQEEEDYRYSYEICRYHHERYDGKGYPEGLSGENIPIAAQIVSLVEAFDALLTNRVYKEKTDFDEAYRMIVEGECGAFSPKLLYCFTLCKKQLLQIYEDHMEKTI